MPSFRYRFFVLALTLVGCASRAPQPRTLANTPPQVIPVAEKPLLPINHSGDTVRYVSTSGGVVEVGLVELEKNRVEVVRLAGKQRDTLFVPPLAIDGVPAQLTDFDYMIDPTANVDGDTPDEFRLTASTSDNTKWTYHVTFLFTWNAARGTFDIAAPTVEKVDRTVCLPCFSDAQPNGIFMRS